MTFNYQERSILAMISFTLAVLYSTAITLITIPPVKLNNVTIDNVLVDDNYFDIHRFDDIKMILPHNTIVGYLPLEQLNDPDLLPKEFYLTQYALSPILLSYSTKPEYIVGNFSDKLSAKKSLKGLKIVKDFGNGIILLRHQL